MKVKLIRPARIRMNAGAVVEIAPADAGFLISTGSAIPVADAAPMRETPEEKITVPEVIAEKVQTVPETKTAAKTTRKGKK